jgi:hypothetical protein
MRKALGETPLQTFPQPTTSNPPQSGDPGKTSGPPQISPAFSMHEREKFLVAAKCIADTVLR